MITEADRQQKMHELETTLEFLYFSPESGQIMSDIFYAADADENQYTEYATAVGDTILGFHTTSALPEILASEAKLSPDVINRVMPELLKFLAPVVSREQARTAVPPSTALTKTLPAAPTPRVPVTSTTAQTTPVVPTMTPDESTKTDDPRLVQPMHTMGSDVSQVHGYQAYRSLFPDQNGLSEDVPTIQSSSQEELLTKKPSLTSTPTYKNDLPA